MPNMLHKDIAIHHKLNVQLVSKLIREADRNPEKLQQLKEKIDINDKKQLAIEEVTISALASSTPIVSAKQIQAKVQEKTGLVVDNPLTRLVMKKDLCMGYRQAKTVPI